MSNIVQPVPFSIFFLFFLNDLLCFLLIQSIFQLSDNSGRTQSRKRSRDDEESSDVSLKWNLKLFNNSCLSGYVSIHYNTYYLFQESLAAHSDVSSADGFKRLKKTTVSHVEVSMYTEYYTIHSVQVCQSLCTQKFKYSHQPLSSNYNTFYLFRCRSIIDRHLKSNRLSIL